MITVDADVVTDHPLPEVFDFVTDLSHDAQWWPGIRSTERVAGDGGVGTRYRLEARFLWFQGVWHIEVLSFERPHRMMISGTGPLNYLCRYEFTPGTRVKLTIELDMSRWMGPIVQFALRYNLRRLDRVLTR